MKTIKDKQNFLHSKGITSNRNEGDDFSTVFHVSGSEFALAKLHKLEWEKELDCYIEASDMFGMNVIIIENKEE
jgi:hypothetical protein